MTVVKYSAGIASKHINGLICGVTIAVPNMIPSHIGPRNSWLHPWRIQLTCWHAARTLHISAFNVIISTWCRWVCLVGRGYEGESRRRRRGVYSLLQPKEDYLIGLQPSSINPGCCLRMSHSFWARKSSCCQLTLYLVSSTILHIADEESSSKKQSYRNRFSAGTQRVPNETALEGSSSKRLLTDKHK